MKLSKYMEKLNKANIKHPNAKGTETRRIVGNLRTCEKCAVYQNNDYGACRCCHE